MFRCGLIIIVASVAGLWSNFYLHAILTEDGVDRVLEVAKNFNSSLQNVIYEAELLGISEQLPVETQEIIDRANSIVIDIQIVEDWVSALESTRESIMTSLYVLSLMLCIFGLIAICWYHKFISLLIFYFGSFMVMMLLLWTGVFQIPSTVIVANLCTDFKGNVLQYLPDEQYIRYYFTCEGENPFEQVFEQAKMALAYLENQTNPDEKTKLEIAELKILVSGLNNMTCNGTEYSTKNLFSYENELICTNFINDLSITTIANMAIAFFAMFLLYAGIKHNFHINPDKYRDPGLRLNSVDP